MNPQFLQSLFNHINSLIYMHEKVSGLAIRQQTQSHAGDTVPPAVKCKMEQLPKTLAHGWCVGAC